jgi:hypothetical protein
MAKMTLGKEIVDGLEDLEIAANIAKLLAAADPLDRDEVLSLADQIVRIFDEKKKKKRT